MCVKCENKKCIKFMKKKKFTLHFRCDMCKIIFWIVFIRKERTYE